MAILIIEKSTSELKVSLRSNPTYNNRDGVDCSVLAQQLSTRGGGHARAAGATVQIEGNFEETFKRIQHQAIQFFNACMR
jgi:single-stranded DNA-specific DHH superfamily exonuclease